MGAPAPAPDPELEPEPEPDPLPAAEAPTAPMAAQRTYLDVPYAEDAVVVLPVATVSPVVLFPDERAAIRRRVARRLTKLGHEVVPIEELERIEAAAADRRLALEADATCRAPLSSEDVHARYFSNMRTASLDAGCDDDCALAIVVEDPSDPNALETYSADVARGWDPGAWKRAATRLEQTDTSIWGGVGGMVASSHPPPIMFSAPDHIGPWTEPPDAEAFFALEDKTKGCGHPDENVALSWTVALEIDAAGRVERCEAETEHSRARVSEAQCICEAANTLQLPTGKSGRRVRVEAIDSGNHARTFVRDIQLKTESWVTRLGESGAPSKCESELTRTERLEATAVLSLTPDGSVQRVELFGPIDDAPTMRWARCLVHEWSSLELPCAPPGIEQLQATVDFRGR